MADHVWIWDTSHWDYTRGGVDVAGARRDGIHGVTAKCTEGGRFYRDDRYATTMGRGRAAGVPILGPYHVLHPPSMASLSSQADWFVGEVDRQTPWWRTEWHHNPGRAWIWQIDAESFVYMTRAPTIDEVNAFARLVCDRAQVPAAAVQAYAPPWLYGTQLTRLQPRLWSSAYGSNEAVHYPNAYPGDDSSRWTLAGVTAFLLQYGSQVRIGTQPGCDISAHRGPLAAFLPAVKSLTTMTTGDGDMPTAKDIALAILAEPVPGTATADHKSPRSVREILADLWYVLMQGRSLGGTTTDAAWLTRTLAAIAAKVDLDPAELAAITAAASQGARDGVLAGFSPAGIAAEIIRVLPEDLARDTAEQIGALIAAGASAPAGH